MSVNLTIEDLKTLAQHLDAVQKSGIEVDSFVVADHRVFLRRGPINKKTVTAQMTEDERAAIEEENNKWYIRGLDHLGTGNTGNKIGKVTRQL